MSGGDPTGRCAACGDVADPMLVLARHGGEARVRTAEGGERTVAVDLVPEAVPGSLILVHQGVAIGTLGGDAVRDLRDLLAVETTR